MYVGVEARQRKMWHIAEDARSVFAAVGPVIPEKPLKPCPGRIRAESVTGIEGNMVLFLFTGHIIPLETVKATY